MFITFCALYLISVVSEFDFGFLQTASTQQDGLY